jgi:hypothetical protein
MLEDRCEREIEENPKFGQGAGVPAASVFYGRGEPADGSYTGLVMGHWIGARRADCIERSYCCLSGPPCRRN